MWLSVYGWGIVPRAIDLLGLVQESEQAVARKAAERLGVNSLPDWSHA